MPETEEPKTIRLSLSPSSASRWSTCTASPYLIAANADKLPKDTSDWAAEGNEAHDWAAKLLEGNCEIGDVPEAMQEPLGAYVAHIQENQEKDDIVYVESKIDLFYMPGRSGYVDYCRINDNIIHIVDLKYGQGVTVEAWHNKQMAIYAMSIIKDFQDLGLFDFAPDIHVRMDIFQPRCRQGSPLKTWVVELQELEQFCAELGDIAKGIQDDPQGGMFKPSESACRFCDAKGICAARAGELLEPLPDAIDPMLAFEDLDAETQEARNLIKGNKHNCNIALLSDEQVVRIFNMRKAINKLCEDVEDHAIKVIENGGTVEGLKMVAGNPGNRRWGDDKTAERHLAEFLPVDQRHAPRKLISPTQAEKLIKDQLAAKSTRFKNAYDKNVVRPEGKPVLALASDERPDLNAVQEFSDLDEDLL